MLHGPRLPEILLGTLGLVGAVGFLSYIGAAAMRGRGEGAGVGMWLLKLWGLGALIWLTLAGALRCWDGDFWSALDAVKAGQGSPVVFTVGTVCAVGMIVTLFRLTRLARAGLGEPPLRPGEDAWPNNDPRRAPGEHTDESTGAEAPARAEEDEDKEERD
jgi:hypothetical protein